MPSLLAHGADAPELFDTDPRLFELMDLADALRASLARDDVDASEDERANA